MMETNDLTPSLRAVKEASRQLPLFSDECRSQALLTLADIMEAEKETLLRANAEDLSRMDKQNPLYDRLQLTPARISGIAEGIRSVARLKSPLGEITEHRRLSNGIDLRKIRVPFGVIGVIYEARPNVTFDVFALCLKTANACVMKGGHDADCSNRAAISLIKRALAAHGLPQDSALLLPSSRESTAALLGATGIVDLCIPRGGRKLIDFVRDNARVPVIETGAGVVHLYFDREGNTEMGASIINNAKTRRVSVCNALDTLIIDATRLNDLPALVVPLSESNVILHCDPRALEVLSGLYPATLLSAETDWDREWMDYQMGIKTVDGINEAIDHIARHGSGHSESIVTDDEAAFRLFASMVDAACVYHNLPTSFTDGGEFGLGAEIGISTQKLGPRGPMGLREITCQKYLLEGNGQLRPR